MDQTPSAAEKQPPTIEQMKEMHEAADEARRRVSKMSCAEKQELEDSARRKIEAGRHSGQAVDRQGEWTAHAYKIHIGSNRSLNVGTNHVATQLVEAHEAELAAERFKYEALTNDAIARDKELAAERQRDMCDACAGTGKPISGKPCMCNGTGRMSEAARTLRRELYDERQRADNAERYERNANAISAALEKRLLSALAALKELQDERAKDKD